MRWLLPALMCVVSCSEDSGSGTVQGSLVIPDCEDGNAADFSCIEPADCTAFDLEPDFFALETTGDTAEIRLQKGGRAFAETDGLLLQIRDVRQLRGNLETRLPVGPSANVRAALGLFELCPDSTQNFELIGDVIFECFGLEFEDRIKGRLEDIEVRDGRGTGRVLGRISVEFDFTVRKGPPHQQFTGN